MVTSVAAVTRVVPAPSPTANPGNASRMVILTRQMATAQKQLALEAEHLPPTKEEVARADAIHTNIATLQARMAQLQQSEAAAAEQEAMRTDHEKAPEEVAEEKRHRTEAEDGADVAAEAAGEPEEMVEPAVSDAPGAAPARAPVSALPGATSSTEMLGQNVDEYV